MLSELRPRIPRGARSLPGTRRRRVSLRRRNDSQGPSTIERAPLFVNSPSNPTAVVQDRRTLAELCSFTDQLAVISDEIYHGLEYGSERSTSALELTNDAFVIDGFSKRFAMTGVRIGWLVAPEDAVPTLQRLQQNLFVCASSIAQQAGIAALQGADVDLSAMRSEYATRRRTLVDGLRRLGFPIPGDPEGAYYVLADARHIGNDSYSLAKTILREANVGVTPGIDFGPGAEGFLRFSFAASNDAIEEGLRRLEAWLPTRPTS